MIHLAAVVKLTVTEVVLQEQLEHFIGVLMPSELRHHGFRSVNDCIMKLLAFKNEENTSKLTKVFSQTADSMQL